MIFSIADKEGFFTGEVKDCYLHEIHLNVPEGFLWSPGIHDHLSKRLDIATGMVIDYQPPSPSDNHEWNADTKRWVLKPEVIARQQRVASARAQIEALELKQLRPDRELRLDPTNAAAAQRLADIDAQIAALREQLK